jgi:hypothetical protein
MRVFLQVRFSFQHTRLNMIRSSVLIVAGYEASQMGASNDRFGPIPSLGRRRSRNRLLDRLFRSLLPERCHTNDRLRLLATEYR